MSLTGPHLCSTHAAAMTCIYCGCALRADNHIDGREHKTHRDCEIALTLIRETVFYALMRWGVERKK